MTSPAGRLKVLLAESDQRVRQFLAEALRGANYSVREATDGLEALGLMEAERPDVVCLSLVMPRHSGVKLLGELNRNSRWRGIPAVVASGRAVDDEGRLELSQLSFSGPGIYLEHCADALEYAEMITRAACCVNPSQEEGAREKLRAEVTAALDEAEQLRHEINDTVEQASSYQLLGLLRLIRSCPFRSQVSQLGGHAHFCGQLYGQQEGVR